MSKQLIVNADDYGKTEEVTRGIIRAHREGIVTSTTVMMNMPQVEDALGLADDYPDLRMGVHLVFTAWRPLLPPAKVPSLMDEDGHFHSQEAILSHPERIDTGELKAELRTQIECFRASGREPDHLDCHHFVHIYPPFFAVYVELAEEYGLPVRLPFPPEEEWDEVAASTALAHGIPPALLREIARQDIGLVQAKGIPHPDRFIRSFYGEEALTLGNLLGILEGLPEGVSEMMTHPGLPDEGLLAKSTYAKERERELELLCHPRVKERIGELGIELANFGVWKQK
ncbi:MAG: carbohydrate deacetylase [Anaerolineae bacterium]